MGEQKRWMDGWLLVMNLTSTLREHTSEGKGVFPEMSNWGRKVPHEFG